MCRTWDCGRLGDAPQCVVDYVSWSKTQCLHLGLERRVPLCVYVCVYVCMSVCLLANVHLIMVICEFLICEAVYSSLDLLRVCMPG